MTDIVERLQGAYEYNGIQMLLDAKSEIERLRAALREIADSKTRTAMALRPIARAALEERT